MAAAIGGEKNGGKKKPKVGAPNHAVRQHKPTGIVLICAWLMFICGASSKLTELRRAFAQRATASWKSQSTHGGTTQEKKTEGGGEAFRQTVDFKHQMGSFRWRHAWQTGCSCFPQVKAEGFLANMHATMETFTHCRRHKACLFPPELPPPPPVSSFHFCQRDPAEGSNS